MNRFWYVREHGHAAIEADQIGGMRYDGLVTRPIEASMPFETFVGAGLDRGSRSRCAAYCLSPS